MRTILKYTALIAFIFLAGCTTYKPPTPAKLTPITPAIQIQEQWCRRLNKGAAHEFLKLNPVIANNKIFIGSTDGTITAANENTGRKIWQFKNLGKKRLVVLGHKLWRETTRKSITSGLAANGNLVFAGTAEGEILALNQNNGELVWKANMTSDVLATPVIANDTLLVKAENGEVRAFDVNSGQLLWTYTHNEPSLILRGGSSPRTFNNTVIIGFASGNIVALDLAKKGKVMWSKTIAKGHGSTIVQRMVDIDVDPQIIDGIIYVATYQGLIAAISIKNQHIIWQHDLSSYSGLAVYADKVFVSDENGHVWAFDRRNGAVIWKQNALQDRQISGPAIVGNAIIVGDKEGYLHFLSQADGHFLARVLVHKNSSIIAKPIVSGKNIYVYTQDGRLAKFIY